MIEPVSSRTGCSKIRIRANLSESIEGMFGHDRVSGSNRSELSERVLARNQRRIRTLRWSHPVAVILWNRRLSNTTQLPNQQCQDKNRHWNVAFHGCHPDKVNPDAKVELAGDLSPICFRLVPTFSPQGVWGGTDQSGIPVRLVLNSGLQQRVTSI